MKYNYLYVAFALPFLLIFTLAFGMAGYGDLLKYEKAFPFILIFMVFWVLYFSNKFDKDNEE